MIGIKILHVKKITSSGWSFYLCADTADPEFDVPFQLEKLEKR
jgi:hypothetical protein